MNVQIVEWINKTFGYSLSADYYKHIDFWFDWWCGYHKPFHHFFHNTGKKIIPRDMYTLKMGKKVCEDWASILLNDKTIIKISDEKTSEFIQGKKETEGILGDNSFWTEANQLIEKAFASGTGAAVINMRGVKLKGNKLQVSSGAKLELSYIAADMIIPLSAVNGKITEAAFASELTDKGKKYIDLEMHLLDEGGNYVIRNYRFENKDGHLTETEAAAGTCIETGSPVPWFSIIKPNIVNTVKGSNGLGVSVLHGAIDALKFVDTAFNNFVTDFRLGGKKVFMRKDLIEYDEDGKAIAPDDVNQHLFTYVTMPIDDNGKTALLQEFNPALRAEENAKGVQSALDYLSFKAGLGNKHYQFNGSTVVTATQYTGEKQDLIQNANKHYIAVERFLISIIRSIIHVGAAVMGEDLDENAEIDIIFDDAVIIDKNAEHESDRQDMRDGVLAKWEYRMKWRGETEEDAKAIIAEIEGDQSDDDIFGFGTGDA